MSDLTTGAVADAIFRDLFSEAIRATATAAHREIERGQVACGICGTRCRSHAPIQQPSYPSATSSLAQSRESSPSKVAMTAAQSGVKRPTGYLVGPEKGTGGGTGIGSGSGRIDSSGNAFFECLVCGRSIASPRYTPHVAGCLNLNGASRRGASRMAAAKARLGASDRSSPSPYVASDNGDSDADSTGGSKRGRKPLPSKRGMSPSKANLVKKVKLSQSGSATPNSRPPHPPSRLGRPPTVPVKAHSASPFSSPEKVSSSRFMSQKTLPGGSLPGSINGTIDGESVSAASGDGGDIPETIPGDDSSDGGDDDY